MSQDPPIPTVLVFVLCDQIITEAGTNKKSLVGLFDRMWVHSVPALHTQAIWIYAKIADAEGEYSFRVEIVRLESGDPVGRVDTNTTQVKDRLAANDIVIKLPPMPIENLGTYEFQLFANNVWIGRTIMSVEQVPPGGPQS